MDLKQVTQRIQDAMLKAQPQTARDDAEKVLHRAATDVRGVTASIRMGRLRLADLESTLADVLQNDEPRLEAVETAIKSVRQTLFDMERFLKSNREVLEVSQTRSLSMVLDDINKILAD